ncbi:MAG: ABC transporter permease subunit [Gammaproteobacteria bacterium]|nr:ABC transporter permease subunit [Gammaproteobacteria bacterium]
MVQLSADARQTRRSRKDLFARYGITMGGIGIIVAILTIFFYLAYVVIPLFETPHSSRVATYAVDDIGEILFLGIDEQSEYATLVDDRAQLVYFRAGNGDVIQRTDLSHHGELVAVSVSNFERGLIALGYANGKALVLRAGFKVTYTGTRQIKPLVEYPFGEQPLAIGDSDIVLKNMAMRSDSESVTIAVTTAEGQVEVAQWVKESSFLDMDDVTLTRSNVTLSGAIKADHVLIDPSQRHLYLAASDGNFEQYLINDIQSIERIERKKIVGDDTQLQLIQFLIGGTSLMVGDSRGNLSQWFNVRGENGEESLQQVRSFGHNGVSLTAYASELRRKGMVTGDRLGNVSILHSTAERELLTIPVSQSAITNIANAPRSDTFIAVDEEEQFHFYHVTNEHPEISFSSLWSEVHYEGFSEPDYIWQSSAANNDFEPKMSLVPLAFGTFKAAFYAMLVAVPLSILGAIYTAYFMSAPMRKLVKPTIEIMEALPTVIIGFLAGLWLAPEIELHLPGVFSLLIVMPLTIFAASYGWWRAPSAWRQRIPDGWEAALLIPVVVFAIWFSMAISMPLERLFFGGDMRLWLNSIGVDFDQRNSIIIGLAMGFAVIPTIFSIAEDAVFSVPKHLTFGSLALGATPWQTMIRVVILTASPGIFSAVMIGLGRAVGETMIVLMATGNTPIMDFNIFEGMRTLAANIAVEMPESEVNSTHYRVLFLTALVLLMFTFFFNTIAEIIRHRLRKKYSSL